MEQESGDHTGNITFVDDAAGNMKQRVGKHQKTEPRDDKTQREAGTGKPVHANHQQRYHEAEQVDLQEDCKINPPRDVGVESRHESRGLFDEMKNKNERCEKKPPRKRVLLHGFHLLFRLHQNPIAYHLQRLG